MLNGTGAPDSSLGVNGDFYIDTKASMLYGPKAGGDWPAGVSLVGPAGAAAGSPVYEKSFSSVTLGNVATVVASLQNLPAGNYLVTVTGAATGVNFTQTTLTCLISPSGDGYTPIGLPLSTDSTSLSAQVTVTVTGIGQVALVCSASLPSTPTANGVITALPVSSIN